MSKNCLDNIKNYANTNNSVNLPNSLTCSFTWLYFSASNEVITGDQTNVPAGDSIASIDVEITDGVSIASASGTAAAFITVDVTALNALLQWRVNYTVTTTNGLTCTVSTFLDPTVPEVITGTSDPNMLPLPIAVTLSGGAHPVQVHEQSFTGLTTWTVAHGTGKGRPLSIEVFRADDVRMFTGISNVLPNSFDIVFFSATSGEVKTIFSN